LSRLKELRRDIARVREVPAYVIFSDRSLHHMCSLKPGTLDEMAQVHGVGPAKLKDLGPEFLNAIVSFTSSAKNIEAGE